MLAESRCGFELVNKFSRIQNIAWIEDFFQPAVHVAHEATGRVWPPSFFCKTDSVLASNYAAPAQHLGEKIIERALDFLANDRVAIVSISHDVDMNVAITGMTKAGDRESVLLL